MSSALPPRCVAGPLWLRTVPLRTVPERAPTCVVGDHGLRADVMSTATIRLARVCARTQTPAVFRRPACPRIAPSGSATVKCGHGGGGLSGEPGRAGHTHIYRGRRAESRCA